MRQAYAIARKKYALFAYVDFHSDRRIATTYACLKRHEPESRVLASMSRLFSTQRGQLGKEFHFYNIFQTT